MTVEVESFPQVAFSKILTPKVAIPKEVNKIVIKPPTIAVMAITEPRFFINALPT